MTEKGRSDKLEVARVTGVQGIRAAMEVLAREADEGEDAALATEEVVAPRPRKTCAVCAADNEGARETCWNCGTSLRRAR
ncbi:hypothetical protein [uncultured Adlercreutzia sp.]|uniref:hypothetical protein n=1 Tax=uncultured Adlercreutzia sp. TaxID=875803 RepID=UPI0026F3E036|nr:hypothetical protein [uncultured Adlercreutzia sp.]